MKRHSKFLASSLCVLILALTLAPPVAAETATSNALPAYPYNFGASPLPYPYNYQGSGIHYAFYADGNTAYCIDPANRYPNGTQTNMGPDWAGVSYGDRRNIALAFLYGFDGATRYGYAADTERVATQIMVWAIMGGFYNNGLESTFLEYAIVGGNRQAVLDVYYAMKVQMLSHYTRPSFCSAFEPTAPIYSTSYSAVTGLHSLTLTDTNGQLGYFNVAAQLAAAGYSATVSGNTITISSSTPFTTQQIISSARTASTHQNPLLMRSIAYLAGGTTQDKVMAYGARVAPDPVPAYFGLQSSTKDIIVIKTDNETGEPIEGAVFEVFDDAGNSLGTITTDESGIATLEDQYYGSYTVKEIQPATGYQPNETEYPYTLDASSGSVSVGNDIKKGYIEVVKRSSFDNKLLEGATYGLYRASDDELIEELTTDENGAVTSSLLRYGRYYIKELEAPERYYLDLNSHYILVGEEHLSTVNSGVKDSPIIGILRAKFLAAAPQLRVGEQHLGVPATGVMYPMTDDQILGYPVPPAAGSTSDAEPEIVYLRIDDDPVVIAATAAAARTGYILSGIVLFVSVGFCLTAVLIQRRRNALEQPDQK